MALRHLGPAMLLLCLLGRPALGAWRSVSVVEMGAKGDNATDNTKAFRAALASVEGGGEVVVPAGGCFRTAPDRGGGARRISRRS